MTNISSKLFNEQVMSSITKLDERIADLQRQTSTGKRNVTFSDNPIDTVELNAGKQLLASVTRFLRNTEVASDRLAQSDIAISSFQPLLARMLELNIQANNDTLNLTDRLAIKAEVDELSELMLGLANSKDKDGVALFGGTQGSVDPFQKTEKNSIEYFGDTGQMQLAISNTKNIATGISGVEAFMNVDVGDRTVSIFDVIKNFADALEAGAKGRPTIGLEPAGTQIEFTLTERPTKISFEITVQSTVHYIEAVVVDGHLENLGQELEKLELPFSFEINENFLTLSPLTDDDIELSNLAASATDDNMLPKFVAKVGEEEWLQRNESLNQSLENFNAAIDHLSLKHAQLGARIEAASAQNDILSNLQISISEDVSELEDSDLAEVITELKQLLLNKDAAQQVYARINQQTVFDFIR